MIGDTGPEYQRLMVQIRSWITAGKYTVGQPIPSTAELHRLTGRSVPVVRRAVDQLKADGILEGHPGKGVYVKAMPAEADSERLDIKGLTDQFATLREQVEKNGPDELRDWVSRLETNLIDLYGKLGFEYPQDVTHDDTRVAAGRGRARG